MADWPSDKLWREGVKTPIAMWNR